MNLSMIVTRVKNELGVGAIATPYKNINEEIREVIQNITVPTFSIYEPYQEPLTLRTTDLELVEKGAFWEEYNLPEFKTRKLLKVYDVQYDSEAMDGLGYYGGGMPFLQGNLINQVMLANAGASVMSFMVPKLTFEFIKPRRIKIYNVYSSSRLTFTLGFEHDKSLASIPDTCLESFYTLALLDCKVNFYPTMKPFMEMNTAVGNVNLRIDDWADAKTDRKELLSEWDNVYHLDEPTPYYI